MYQAIVFLPLIGFLVVGLFGNSLGDLVSMTGSNGGDQPFGSYEEPTAVAAAPRPTATRRPTSASSSPGSGDTWTILLYQDADDKVLEKDIYRKI